MRTRLSTFALAGTLGLSGLAGAALIAPAVSYAATGDSTALTSLKSALTGLVSDGSITQAQADEVATVLAEARPEGLGHGGPGGHGGRGGRLDLAAAAEALGMTEDELRTQTAAGKTLADVADAEGVDQADLVKALVAAEEERLAAAVTDGRLTQAQADERAEGLEARITDKLDELCGPGRGGPRGDAPAPSQTPSEAPTSDSSTATTDSAA